MAYRGKDLAGTNGIPLHEERVYVQVTMSDDKGSGRAVMPARLTWPDGRSWRIASASLVASYGRELFGNQVDRYDVTIARKRRTLWHDRGGWFVCRKQSSRSQAQY